MQKLKVAQALSFALPSPDQQPASEGVELQAPKGNSRRKQYQGTPLRIYFDGGFAKDVGVAGFKVVGPEGNELVRVGTYDVGYTNN